MFLAQNAQLLPAGVKQEQDVEIKQDFPARLANLVLHMPEAASARN
jgi:hypothetical protein